MKNKLNILVADDHVIFAKTFSNYILGFAWCNTVYTVFNGKQVIDTVSTVKIDLVFLDHRMPVMDGYETTLILKKQFPAIKIIVLSQFDSVELINHYLNAGAHAYLLKKR
jgi:two-component system, NarL family, response regulator DegU